MNGVWMEVPPKSYLYNFYGDYCMIGIQSSGAHYWLLGDVFIKNFYTVWDNTNELFGIGPHKTSSSNYMTTANDMSAPTHYFTTLSIVENIVADATKVVAKVGVSVLLARGAVWLIMHAYHALFGVDNFFGYTKYNIHTLFV